MWWDGDGMVPGRGRVAEVGWDGQVIRWDLWNQDQDRDRLRAWMVRDGPSLRPSARRSTRRVQHAFNSGDHAKSLWGKP